VELNGIADEGFITFSCFIRDCIENWGKSTKPRVSYSAQEG
jgi:hypothetical protein